MWRLVDLLTWLIMTQWHDLTFELWVTVWCKHFTYLFLSRSALSLFLFLTFVFLSLSFFLHSLWNYLFVTYYTILNEWMNVIWSSISCIETNIMLTFNGSLYPPFMCSRLLVGVKWPYHLIYRAHLIGTALLHLLNLCNHSNQHFSIVTSILP